MIIRTRAYARAGLIGNPSDGYFGKTIAVILRNFCAEVTCYQTPKLAIIPCRMDHSAFESLAGLYNDVRANGYYGGVRLLKGTLKRFYEYCIENDIMLEDKNCTLEYRSDIPLRLGMGGSSAIIIATLRALFHFYGVDVALAQMPNLALSVERDELEIGAGLQDRVIQCYEGCVYMDFDQSLMEKQGYGRYVSLDPMILPPLFVAYDDGAGEGTEVVHNDLRGRWNAGDPQVHEAMTQFAGLAEKCYELLLARNSDAIGSLMDENFNLRQRIMNLNPRHVHLIEAGRSAGAHVSYAGSGGAVIGTYKDKEHFDRIAAAYSAIGARLIKPDIRDRSL
ncbi:MAG: GHMP kinase [Candidatus Sumerlaeota bacterium]|nr:GHMP kinase [Candidatus Sumerlaeota bacterium]